MLRRPLFLPIATALVLVLITAIPARPQSAPGQGDARPEPGTIRVSGRATVTAAPDRAEVDIGISTQAAASREAVTANARAATAVMKALEALGTSVTVETIGYVVTPEYRRDEGRGAPKVAGYRALTMLRATVSDLPRVGEVIDTASKAGANEIGGVRFTLHDERAVQGKALGLAAANARAKAEAMASALGLRLAHVVSVSESEPSIRPMMQEARAFTAEAGAPAPPMQPGVIEVEAFVTLAIAIAR